MIMRGGGGGPDFPSSSSSLLPRQFAAGKIKKPKVFRQDRIFADDISKEGRGGGKTTRNSALWWVVVSPSDRMVPSSVSVRLSALLFLIVLMVSSAREA